MDGVGISNVALSARTGIDQTTISRYRSARYPSGPPSAPRRRVLEQGLYLPAGYLDGAADADFGAIRLQLAMAQGGRTAARDNGASAKAGGPGSAYQTALLTLSRLASAAGTVPLADAVYWISVVYAAGRDTAHENGGR